MILQAAMESIKKAKINAEKCPYRPEYHFLAPANWMNDPNGPIYYKGEYHLFYQHNPYGEDWGNIHWGHAKSKDLVNWEHLPIALTPSSDLGEKHCFSGCCVNNKGVPTIIYTSIKSEKSIATEAEQWMATSSDDMITWQKSSHNPVLSLNLHDNLDVRHWRDPYVWKEEENWYMILGGHIHNMQAGVVLLYKSSNLEQWEYLYPLCEGEERNRITGSNWECPNFFPLNNKHILIISPHKKVIYNIGIYKNHKFKPGKWRFLDHGRSFYAPNTMIDKNGRVIMWAWVREGGTGGWNGCLTLPRILSLGDDNSMRFTPAPELQLLRTNHIHLENVLITPKSKNILGNIRGSCLEIIGTMEVATAGKFGFKIFQNNNYENGEIIEIKAEKRFLRVGKEKSKIDFLLNENLIKFHIFIDRSVVEVYLNDKECLTCRIYPKILESDYIDVFSTEEDINLRSLDIWKLKSIWK